MNPSSHPVLFRRLKTGASSLISILSLTFVALVLWEGVDHQALLRFFSAELLPVMSGVALVYTLTLFAPTFGWFVLLRESMDGSVHLKDATVVYGRTLIGKYLPGNVFHYISRQLIGANYGWTQSALAVASVQEVLLVTSAGASLSLVGILVGEPIRISGISSEIVLVVGVLGAIGPWLLMAFLHFAPSFVRLPKFLLSATVHFRPLVLLKSFVSYVAFIGLSAILLWVFAAVMGKGINLSVVVGGYGLIYVLSYLAPGAPGGIGVREALLILVLEEQLGAGPSGLIVVALRVAMICGEAVYFALSILLGAPSEKTSKKHDMTI